MALETAQRASAQSELQSKHASFAEKTSAAGRTLEEEHVTVVQLREEATRGSSSRRRPRASEGRVKLERWQLKANEGRCVRLQAEEVAQQKSLAQAGGEAEGGGRAGGTARGKAEETGCAAARLAEQELERRDAGPGGTAQQPGRRAGADPAARRTEQGEQQRRCWRRSWRGCRTAAAATQKRQELEAELAKVRAEMEVLLASKARAEEVALQQ